MNSDSIKGNVDDATGRAKRQVGEWTGDTHTQADGAAQQVKGKLEKVVGEIRDEFNKVTGHKAEHTTDIDDNLDKESVRDRT